MEDQAFTTIMLRKLDRHFNMEMLLEKLDAIIPRASVDFVYLPWDMRRQKNIAMAFINFVDVESAELCYKSFLEARDDPQRGSSQHKVSKANVQGLGPNLAYFIATCGLKDVTHPHAPQVFEDGVRALDLRAAIQTYVTVEMLLDAKQLVADIMLNEKAAGRGAGGGLSSAGGSDAYDGRTSWQAGQPRRGQVETNEYSSFGGAGSDPMYRQPQGQGSSPTRQHFGSYEMQFSSPTAGNSSACEVFSGSSMGSDAIYMQSKSFPNSSYATQFPRQQGVLETLARNEFDDDFHSHAETLGMHPFAYLAYLDSEGSSSSVDSRSGSSYLQQTPPPQPRYLPPSTSLAPPLFNVQCDLDDLLVSGSDQGNYLSFEL
ncbi:unnamed protein product [Polarella glacialis]|uniref:Mei2-like C-terminal RNA recognition motif domain-containing protein n=1 Tax=Polarella glacialis TaxID=89957 RepID=A0A813HZ14_POLGL|nr:unnamed protein product [Polarella glacialis]